MKIEIINELEYLEFLESNVRYIPVWCGKEAIECYENKELIKVVKNDVELAVFLIPLDTDGVRRKYRFFPYLMPITLERMNILRKKEVYKVIFNYLFNKYNYTFIPLHPEFKIVSSISSQGGLVEMRHTHVINKSLILDELNSKLKNHIKHAKNSVELIIDNDCTEYDFFKAIKGSVQEQKERSELAKRMIDRNKGVVVKVKYKDRIIAGLIVVFDQEWAYLLHSYQEAGEVRGIVPYMIFEATNYLFNKKKIKYFDFEGSVIDEIDDFFSTFDADIITYPYIIFSKNEDKFKYLINRSLKIEGRIKEYERN